MRKSLIAVGMLLVSGLVGNAQEKPSVRVVIQAPPEQIKKAAFGNVHGKWLLNRLGHGLAVKSLKAVH